MTRYRFYENPAHELVDNSEDRWASPTDYWKEINYISKKHSVEVSAIQIDDVTFGGEPVAFIGGKYWGYLDFYFYMEMDCGVIIEDEEFWDRYKEWKK